MNEVLLVGRLTKDPDLRMTQSGSDITKITIAINRQYELDYKTSVIQIMMAKKYTKMK